MRKYQCNACGIRICTAEYQDGSGVPFKCTCGAASVYNPQRIEIEQDFYKGETKVKEQRWKPEKGEMYWYIWNDGVVCWCNFTWTSDERRFKSGNCFKTEEEAKAAAEKVKALLLSLHGEVATLPKLTTEFFNRSDCPENVQYAVVTSKGRVIGCTSKPYINKEYDCWGFDSGCAYTISIDGTFDASDWRNSLIKRPAKLPDWCKVGEWVYLCNCTYSRIVSINDCHVNLENGISVGKNSIHEEMVSARLRPYNAEEMKALVGTVLTSNSRSNPFSFLVVYAEGDGSFVESHRFEYTAKELKDYFNIEGNPCGVLEHLEEGKWVE